STHVIFDGAAIEYLPMFHSYFQIYHLVPKLRAMATHSDLLNNLPRVRSALISRYGWFIHTTPEENIDNIRRDGLRPHMDAGPEPDVVLILGDGGREILCLHPLGAKLYPQGANANVVIPMGECNPKRVSLAIAAEDLPATLGLDWSFDWLRVQ